MALTRPIRSGDRRQATDYFPDRIWDPVGPPRGFILQGRIAQLATTGMAESNVLSNFSKRASWLLPHNPVRRYRGPRGLAIGSSRRGRNEKSMDEEEPAFKHVAERREFHRGFCERTCNGSSQMRDRCILDRCLASAQGQQEKVEAIAYNSFAGIVGESAHA